jgi:hypothetical protein
MTPVFRIIATCGCLRLLRRIASLLFLCHFCVFGRIIRITGTHEDRLTLTLVL